MKFRNIAILSFVAVMFVFYTQANAVDVTPYYKIAEDYNSNIISARRTWLGKEICIEGVVSTILVTKAGNSTLENHVAVWLSENTRAINKVRYIFSFDGIPDEVMELQKGQKIKISGIVDSIEPSRIILRINIRRAKLEDIGEGSEY